MIVAVELVYCGGSKYLRVDMVLTVRVNFNAKRQENKILILAIVLCRNLILFV